MLLPASPFAQSCDVPCCGTVVAVYLPTVNRARWLSRRGAALGKVCDAPSAAPQTPGQVSPAQQSQAGDQGCVRVALARATWWKGTHKFGQDDTRVRMLQLGWLLQGNHPPALPSSSTMCQPSAGDAFASPQSGTMTGGITRGQAKWCLQVSWLFLPVLTGCLHILSPFPENSHEGCLHPAALPARLPVKIQKLQKLQRMAPDPA